MNKQRLKRDGQPVKSRKYNSFASCNNNWKTLEEVGAIIGVSKNRISQIIDGALLKVAESVLLDIHGKKPRQEAIERLSKDEAFQSELAQELAALQSRADQSDHEA